MPRVSNFFEEAMRLCQDNDPNVSRLADVAYYASLEEYQRRNLSPQGSFNLLYFFQTIIRAWLLERPTVTLRGNTEFPHKCEPISGINWPKTETCNPIANCFVNLVKADSDSAGDEFDVSYAVMIIELLFGEDGEIKYRHPHDIKDVDFDYWLTGFNSR